MSDCEDHECMACKEGPEAAREWTKNAIKEHGFAIHFVTEPDVHGLANLHTHGFPETWDHPDLQIVIPLNQETASGIMWTIADRVKAGEVFGDGQRLKGVIGGDMELGIKRVLSDEPSRPLIRILLPDPQGILPGDAGCDPRYAEQAIDPSSC